MSSGAPKLVDLLPEWRARERKTQGDVASVLSLSRKTYVFFETGRWLPSDREKHFFAHALHGLDPRLGDAFARACGTTGEALGLPKPAAAAPGAAQARVAYDAAVYSAAEEAEVPPKTARVLVAAVIAKLREAGVTMRQAEDLGRRP
jgi:DNA-binding XRE family transcriptional regulator